MFEQSPEFKYWLYPCVTCSLPRKWRYLCISVLVWTRSAIEVTTHILSAQTIWAPKAKDGPQHCTVQGVWSELWWNCSLQEGTGRFSILCISIFIAVSIAFWCNTSWASPAVHICFFVIFYFRVDNSIGKVNLWPKN